METIIIAAVTDNGVIGLDGDMPWHYPADLRHFERTTTGHACLMGRRTYESFPRRPLRNRINIVLTSNAEYEVPPDVIVVDSLKTGLATAAKSGVTRLFICGGARVYEEALPFVDEMILTRIHAQIDGDTYFPQWDADEFDIVDRRDLDADDLEVITYRRKPNS
tara:strand:- start:91 stop:582 length:492 start_codon:yes stop_codon:yes gene_type:complete